MFSRLTNFVAKWQTGEKKLWIFRPNSNFETQNILRILHQLKTTPIMRNSIFILSLLALSLSSFAAKEKPAAGSFAHHCGEFHLTPSADYFIYSKGKNYEKPEP